MHLKKSFILSASLLLLILSFTVMAQLGKSAMTGSVSDISGAAIGGAIITISNVATGQVQEIVSQEDGSFKISELTPAQYELKFSTPGFTSVKVREVALRIGETYNFKIVLKPEATEEVITISATDSPSIDMTASQVSGNISETSISNLPLNGRNFLDLALLLPGNTIAPNFDPTKTNTVEISSAGQLGRTNNISVDGANNNDDFVGGTLQNFPIDSVQEFQIATNRFGAEVGRSGSAVINIITKSGSNELHGSAAFFFRNDSLSALPAVLDRSFISELGRPPFDRQQYAGSLGGPIKKDKLWFFSSFEYRAQDAIIVNVERDLSRRTIINGYAPAPLNDLLFLGKVDWQTTQNDRMSFRYALQDEEDVNFGDAASRSSSTKENRQRATNNYNSFAYNWVHVFSPKLLNNFLFQESYFRNRLSAFSDRPTLFFPTISDGSNFLVPQSTKQNRIQLSDNLSFNAGKHFLKFGGEFQQISTDLDLGLFLRGAIFLTQNFADVDRNGDNRVDDLDIPIDFTLNLINPRVASSPDNNNKYIAFYVQDDWRIARNFTLNLGLRYEVDTDVNNSANFSEASPFATALVPGKPQIDSNNFGPRIGFNWDTFSNGRFSVHGGYGIYYERVLLQIPALVRLFNGQTLVEQILSGTEFDDDGNFLPGTPTLANPFSGFPFFAFVGDGISYVDPRLSTPYQQQFNLGIKWEVKPGLIVSVDGVHNFGNKLLSRRPIGEVVLPVLDSPSPIQFYESGAKSWYDGMLISVEKKPSKNFSFIASYTLSKALNYYNDDQITPDPSDPNSIKDNKAFTPNDARHRFSFASVVNLPKGFQLSPIFKLESSVPFNITLDDGFTRLPIAQRNAGARQFKTGAQLNAFIQLLNSGGGGPDGMPIPLVNDNLKFGDSFTTFDMRISKFIRLTERMRVQAVVEVFNLFNITNIRGVDTFSFSGFQTALVRDSNDPSNAGFQRSSTFGSKAQTAGGVFGTGGPRAFQFAVRFSF